MPVDRAVDEKKSDVVRVAIHASAGLDSFFLLLDFSSAKVGSSATLLFISLSSVGDEREREKKRNFFDTRARSGIFCRGNA